MTISVVIPTLNSGEKLKRCLNSIKWANEIIVVDMKSNDGTRDIANSYGAKVFIRVPKDGNFDTNRKFGMKKATGDFILKIDDDEELSLKLQAEIQNLLSNSNTHFNGFNIYNRIFMFQQRINHGFVKNGSHELRLFKKGKWHYYPYKFHQLISVEGDAGFLKNYYDHHNVYNVNEYIKKMNKYTGFDANFYIKKISILAVFLAPFRSFFKLFLFQAGYLDRRIGFEVCYLYALYNLVEKVKVWEKNYL